MMCNQRYEDREKGIWKEMCTNDEGDVNKHKVYSYFFKQDRGQRVTITSKVFQPPEQDFTILYDLGKAMGQVVDKIFTTKLTKGRRVTMRKDFLDMPPYDTYTWISLLEYLRQCRKEGHTKCLLSKKEYSMIQPKLTKKQERDKRLSKNLMSY